MIYNIYCLTFKIIPCFFWYTVYDRLLIYKMAKCDLLKQKLYSILFKMVERLFYKIKQEILQSCLLLYYCLQVTFLCFHFQRI